MFSKFNPFKRESITKVVETELYEAERKLLEAQTLLEYYKAQVDFQTNRVARLKKTLNANAKPSTYTEPEIVDSKLKTA